MTVIEASSAGVKDMADGSLRITFEFEPRHAAEAFALFGPRGRAVAIAALKDGAAAVTEKPVSEKPKGGEWAKLAGMWCANPEFWEWMASIPGVRVPRDSGEAAELLKDACDIGSRVELDHDQAALARFNKVIRFPFMKWMQARGISK